MSIDVTVTIRRECHYCGGVGKYQANLYGRKTFIEIDCPECNSEGVSEQQIGLREFRHMLEADGKREQIEQDAGRFAEVEDQRGDGQADPIEEAEVRDAEQT